MPKDKLKIGFVFDDSLDGNDGVAQYVRTLGGWLSHQGHEVCYLVGETAISNWRGGRVYSLAKNIKVKFNGNRVGTPLPAKTSKIKALLKSEEFDVLHVQVPYSPLLASRVIVNASPNTAVIGTFHIMPISSLVRMATRLLGLVSWRSAKKFDRLLSVSSVAAEFAASTYRLHSDVVPNVADARFYKSAKTNRHRGRIVFLGRLVERKGCRYLIEAFKIVHRKMPQTSLEIAGAGPEMAHLKKLTAELGLSPSVKFLGFVGEEEKARLLASADVACFPSTGGESFGIVLIEAMAAGAGVVIGGDNPGYRTVLGKREVCLFNPHDVPELAARLIKLFSDHELASQLHAWQQSQIDLYDVNIVGHHIVDIYRRAIAKKRTSKA